jgi:hypothetical protein
MVVVMVLFVMLMMIMVVLGVARLDENCRQLCILREVAYTNLSGDEFVLYLMSCS